MRQVLLLCLAFALPIRAQHAAHPGTPEQASHSGLAHATGAGRSRAVEGPTNSTPSHRPVNDRRRSTTRIAAAAHRQGAPRGAGATAGATSRNTGYGTASHLRPQPGLVAPRPSPATARHRGANPAVVSGAANSTPRNAGSLNGSLMAHKP